MTEIQHRLADLIQFSSAQKPIEFTDVFNSLINARVETAIGAKKIDVAQRMFNSSHESEDDTYEIETEEG